MSFIDPQRAPRNTMVRQLAQRLMGQAATPAYGATGAFTNFAAPVLGSLINRRENRREREQAQAETSAMGRLLAKAEEARRSGEDPISAVNELLAAESRTPGMATAGRQFLGGYQENLARTLAQPASTESPETFGAPMTVMGPEGNPVLVRPGSRGTMQPVEGYSPVPKASERPRYATDLGKTLADIRTAEAEYGKGSPQAQALRELAQSERSGEPKDIKSEAGLRKEFTSQSKDFVSVRDAFGKVRKAAESPSAAGDLSLIFNYMKMLDPGSVVREGEFATAQNAAGVDDRIRNTYNRLLSGERLNPDQRQDFVGQAGNVYLSQKQQQDQLEAEFNRISELTGVRPDAVIIDFQGDFRDYEQPEAGAVVAGAETTGLPTAADLAGSSSAEFSEGTIIRNPETGERRRMEGGRWVKVE